jgi:hypothetical protein
MLPRTGNDFINGHHVPWIFTDVPGVFLIGAWPNIRQQPSLPLIVAISVQGRRCTHVSGPGYSTVHINCLPPDITGIAAGNELFYSDQHGFSTGAVQCAWLLGTGLHVLLCVEGCSLNMMHLLYRLYWFVVLPAHRYCSTSDRRHCHLHVLVQQDIDLRHSPCFEDLTKAITLHVVSNIFGVFCALHAFFWLRCQVGKRRFKKNLECTGRFQAFLQSSML